MLEGLASGLDIVNDAFAQVLLHLVEHQFLDHDLLLLLGFGQGVAIAMGSPALVIFHNFVNLFFNCLDHTLE